jgi:hypothetical protein
MPETKIVQAAKFGGTRGVPFDDFLAARAGSGARFPISSIRSLTPVVGAVEHLTCLKGISTTYQRLNGASYVATHGAVGAGPTYTSAPDEHIIGIKGRSGALVDQLTLLGRTGSALTSFGPHGGGGGGPFELKGHIVAFHGTTVRTGRGETILESLGVYIRAHFYGMFGGTGGSEFEDPIAVPGLSAIRGIRIRRGGVIDAIQVTYDTPSGRQEGPQHGGNGGEADGFYLRAGERITAVFGRTGAYLDSIGFLTEDHLGIRRSYGPYGGGGGGNPFIVHGEVIGFAGRSGGLIDAIGFYTLW